MCNVAEAAEGFVGVLVIDFCIGGELGWAMKGLSKENIVHHAIVVSFRGRFRCNLLCITR